MAEEVFQITRKVVIDGAAHQNVIHVRDLIGGDNRETLIAAKWNGTVGGPGVEGTFTDAQTGGTSYTKVGLTVQQIHPILKDPVEFSLLNTLPSLGAGLPTFVAVVHQIRTGFASRSKRGRFFVSGIAEIDTNGQYLGGGGISKHEAIDLRFRRDWMAGGTGYDNFELGIWSRKLNEFTPAATISHTTLLASIRRRKLGVGV